MLKLDTDININFRNFWQWWGLELASMLPMNVRRLFIQRHHYLLANFSNNKVFLYWVERDQVKEVGRFAMGASGKFDFQTLLLNQPELAELDLVIRLPEQDAVAKQISLPAAASDNLNQVVTYELDRLTPFKLDQVYFAVKKNINQDVSDHVQAMLIVSPKAKLQRHLEQLSDWGMVPTIVDYQSVTNVINKRESEYNLLPENLRAKKKRSSELLINMMLLAVMVLLLLAIALPVWMESQTVDLLSAEIAAVEEDVKTIDSYKIEVDDLYKEARELIDNKKSQPSALAMLNVLSELIGDDTWLTHFKYNNGSIQIQGQSPTASLLIGKLEASPLFEDTHFVSPVTQDKKTGLERFQVAAKVGRGAIDE